MTMPFATANPLDTSEDDTRVTVGAAEVRRLRCIEAAAAHFVALRDAHSRAQVAGQASVNASPTTEAPARAALLEAERALREAVHR